MKVEAQCTFKPHDNCKLLLIKTLPKRVQKVRLDTTVELFGTLALLALALCSRDRRFVGRPFPVRVRYLRRDRLWFRGPLGDLVQEGNVGLMKAVKRFDPTKGVRLVSFAVHWIKAEIHEFILRNWKIVKVATTKAQRKLFFNLRSLKRQLNCSDSLTEDDVERIAETLKVKNNDVEEMNIRLSYSDSSIDYQEENGLSQSLRASGADPYEILSNDQEQFKIKNTITEALKELDDRSKQIIEARWLKLRDGAKPKTLKELANELGVSAERVRQIETAAFKKLKEKLSIN